MKHYTHHNTDHTCTDHELDALNAVLDVRLNDMRGDQPADEWIEQNGDTYKALIERTFGEVMA